MRGAVLSGRDYFAIPYPLSMKPTDLRRLLSLICGVAVLPGCGSTKLRVVDLDGKVQLVRSLEYSDLGSAVLRAAGDRGVIWNNRDRIYFLRYGEHTPRLVTRSPHHDMAANAERLFIRDDAAQVIRTVPLSGGAALGFVAVGRASSSAAPALVASAHHLAWLEDDNAPGGDVLHVVNQIGQLNFERKLDFKVVSFVLTDESVYLASAGGGVFRIALADRPVERVDQCKSGDAEISSGESGQVFEQCGKELRRITSSKGMEIVGKTDDEKASYHPAARVFLGIRKSGSLTEERQYLRKRPIDGSAWSDVTELLVDMHPREMVVVHGWIYLVETKTSPWDS